MKIYYDKDADLSVIRSKKVAILGFGSQGHAHASNLKDSGVDVVVGLRVDSASTRKVEAAGIPCVSVDEAVKQSDVVMILVPDECHADLYRDHIENNIKTGAALAFAHGFSIHFSLIEPRSDLDVFMVAPKGPGHLVRSTYSRGEGVPTLIAVDKDKSGNTHALALSYASANGGGRAAIIETSFREEAETDLFGEQAVLCGGLVELIKAGFDTLVEAGYAPEMAYFECLHELKLIVDLIYEGGIGNMYYSVSNTAEYGAVSRGNRIVNEQAREQMKKLLAEIRSGEFAKEFIAEKQTGMKRLHAEREEISEHMVEKVGSQLRSMMTWIGKDKLVDKDIN